MTSTLGNTSLATRTVRRLSAWGLAAILFLSACSGGDGGGGSDRGCDGTCPEASLTAQDVRLILAQALEESRETPLSETDRQALLTAAPPRLFELPAGSSTDPNNIATVVVVDRVGNVLGAIQTPAAAAGSGATVLITSGRSGVRGLDGLSQLPLPDSSDTAPITTLAAAISKAGTAAYLSSQGNAFTTRTASQIIQQNFNPNETRRAGGPLFGVQFSQLPCGDFVRRAELDAFRGPKRMPLGLAGDPGGLPLYKDGVLVGAVGVEMNGIYTVDLVISDVDDAPEERVATAATQGFRAPQNREANQIAIDGRTLRFADDTAARTNPGATAAALAEVEELVVDIPAFYCSGTDTAPGACAAPGPGPFFSGATIGTLASGIRRDDDSFQTEAGEPIFAEVIVGPGDTNRYPPTDSMYPTAGTGAGGGLLASEVRTLLEESLAVASRMRSQIRKPTNSSVRINVSVVDLDGNVLGFARRPDSPLFGADVSLQKARTAAFFSRGPPALPDALQSAASQLTAAPPVPADPPELRQRFHDPFFYLQALRTFLDDPAALENGIAFSDRAGGNLSRPFFPDGVNGRPNGPLSLPFAEWSPFSTGLQLDTTAIQLVASLLNNEVTSCTAEIQPPPDSAYPLKTIRSGTQIFPGSVPIFRGSSLIGGIGVSGDGVDQDDMVSFLGLFNAGERLGGAINLPPRDTPRADTIEVDGVQLRFISCPPKPFLGSDEQTPCEGK